MQKKPYSPPRLRLLGTTRDGMTFAARFAELAGGGVAVELEPIGDDAKAFAEELELELEHAKNGTG